MIKLLFWSEFASFQVGVGGGASCQGQDIFTPVCAGWAEGGGQAAQVRISYPPPQPVWRMIDNIKS